MVCPQDFSCLRLNKSGSNFNQNEIIAEYWQPVFSEASLLQKFKTLWRLRLVAAIGESEFVKTLYQNHVTTSFDFGAYFEEMSLYEDE